jgi:hypothetical protein|tara:strand:+ start:423 stop:590 length:168 start_codon:yes stop_codon:yes gene_type:complete
MIDVLNEIEYLEKIKDAAEDKDFAKVIELCRDKIHDNVKIVKDFEFANHLDESSN